MRVNPCFQSTQNSLLARTIERQNRSLSNSENPKIAGLLALSFNQVNASDLTSNHNVLFFDSQPNPMPHPESTFALLRYTTYGEERSCFCRI